VETGSVPAERRQPAIERLLKRERPHRARRLTPRERAVEAIGAAAFVAVAAGLPLVLPGARPWDAVAVLVLVACHAGASRIRLYVGAGFGMPSQLVLVPMLLLLPASAVPAAVACALAGSALLNVARGRSHPERLLTAVNDAWYAVGGALVILAAGEPAPSVAAVPAVLGALGAQCAVDLVTTTLRERIGRGIPAGLQAQVIALVYLVDLLVTPMAMLTAAAGLRHPAAILALVPLLALLALFARDRRLRIEETVQRVDALDEERARLERALRRVGEAFAANLDPDALRQLALRTVTDAVRAERGQLLRPGDDAEAALAAAARAAGERGGSAVASHGGEHALAQPLVGAGPGEVLVVGRRDRPFGPDEQALLGHLASGVSVALENVELHERLRAQASTDELTGLANHRRFQERLAGEVQRARRTHEPLALVLLDIDDFKRVNDTHGHPCGDAVLRAVAGVLAAHCRVTDEPARYGGEELALILPATDVAGARTVAEGIRRALHALAVPAGGSQRIRITASLGVSAFGPGCEDAAALVATADAALYEAKRAGKDRTAVGRPATTPRDRGRFTASASRAPGA
jgi:diguanylate cyclase (GGDEF)-like protein